MAVRVWRMRKAIKIDVSEADRQALIAIVTDRNSSQKHVWRAQIVLLTADGCGTMELTRRSGTSKTSVWRWQERFLAEGVAGLLRDKTRRQEAASADLQAAAYWRNVTRSDRSEINVAVTKIRELTAAAQCEEKEPNESPRRTRGLSTC